MALLAFDFRVTAAVAAGVFAVLTVAQLMALPRHRAEPVEQRSSVLEDWRSVVANRGFVLFAVAMVGSYVLSFQVYLALPLQAAELRPGNETVLVAAIFVVSGLIAVGGQLRITRWFADRWGSRRSLVVGLLVLAAAFVPMAVVPDGDRFGTGAAVAALAAWVPMLVCTHGAAGAEAHRGDEHARVGAEHVERAALLGQREAVQLGRDAPITTPREGGGQPQHERIGLRRCDHRVDSWAALRTCTTTGAASRRRSTAATAAWPAGLK